MQLLLPQSAAGRRLPAPWVNVQSPRTEGSDRSSRLQAQEHSQPTSLSVCTLYLTREVTKNHKPRERPPIPPVLPPPLTACPCQ